MGALAVRWGPLLAVAAEPCLAREICMVFELVGSWSMACAYHIAPVCVLSAPWYGHMEQGVSRTFLLRHVTQLRGLSELDTAAEGR